MCRPDDQCHQNVLGFNEESLITNVHNGIKKKITFYKVCVHKYMCTTVTISTSLLGEMLINFKHYKHLCISFSLKGEEIPYKS